MDNENQPKSTEDRLAETLANLTSDQMRFVIARNEHSSDKEAAEAIDMSPSTIKGWKVKGVPIDDAVRLMAFDGIVMATELRRRNLAKAMAVKVQGLDSESDMVAQKVSTEIIEWEMGKATQRSEVTGKDGGPIETKTDGLSDEERIARTVAILDAGRARRAGQTDN